MSELSDPPKVTAAAQWLADQKEPPSPVVPILRERFGLSALDACNACKLAQTFRTNRKAFG
ncbi:hypothetical protein NXC12_CH00510 [Rhizobium etli]|uniref:Uncharacterized protein n=1 Tax=Rhizobium etli TaxID=29449 RepID=A0AAN1BCT1_RHIET|nr:hypothetical protein [Rhizobium etli]ARQ08601.1 hypothetical protein NXC12_CH00510 [Rhizobium etli]